MVTPKEPLPLPQEFELGQNQVTSQRKQIWDKDPNNCERHYDIVTDTITHESIIYCSNTSIVPPLGGVIGFNYKETESNKQEGSPLVVMKGESVNCVLELTNCAITPQSSIQDTPHEENYKELQFEPLLKSPSLVPYTSKSCALDEDFNPVLDFRTQCPKTPCDFVQLTQVRKNRSGTKTKNLYSWSNCELDNLDSPCSLQEYLQDLIRNSKDDVDLLLKIPKGQTPDIWLYEHLRQVCLELSYFVVQIQTECTKEICPEMKANEWFYLCAAHPTPQSCCAIDYIIHTLDGASSLLNSSKYFPSRLTTPTNSVKHFLSIARRLYRIFAHAWYHHQTIFSEFESKTYLYSRFLKLSINFSLIPKTLINIPAYSS